MGAAPIPAAVAFTGGVLAVQLLAALPPQWLLALAAMPAFLPWRGRALWALLVLGALLTAWRAQATLDDRWPAAQHGSDVTAEGHIASLPEREGENWRFVFEPSMPQLPRRIRTAWYRTGEVVRGGECWRFTLRLRTPHGSLNPGSFDYEGWLFRQNVGATATVRAAERCAGTAAGVLGWRQHIADRVRAALAGSGAAGIAAALVVGDRSGIAAADWELFRLTGTTHLVAISGFNIAIVAGVAFFIGRWAWALWPPLCLRLPAQRAGLVGAAVLAGCYALLAGFDPPVQRAVLMLWIVLVALWVHRRSAPARMLALAWIAVLALDPLALGSPGLWLSFAAVAAIFYTSLARVRAPGAWHGLVALQLLIAIALAPLALFFFQGTSLVAPLVNLFAVPYFAVLTPWLLGAVLLELGMPELDAPLVAAAWTLEHFHAGLAWVAALPAPWLALNPPVPALLLAALGVVLLYAPRALPLQPLGALGIAALLLVPGAAPRSGFELTVLDVGQGLAVVVRTPHHTLLYDAGPAFTDGFDAGAAVVAPFLLRSGVRGIDLLVLSHGDNDHAGGVAAVRRLLDVRAEMGTPYGEPCRAGRSWVWDGVRFEILHPDTASASGNNGSCVLRIAGPFSVLLPGDLEASGEHALLRRADVRADVLVAPHHGSATSSSPAFVAAVAPQVVIHSAGWRNHFRHPRPEVTARYAAAGARQYATGAGGAITITQDFGELRADEYRRQAARFWNAPAGP